MSSAAKSQKPALQCQILKRETTKGERRPGITSETTGSQVQHLTLFTVGPGQIDEPVHTHPVESAGYVISGRLGLYFGDQLEKYEEAGPGDFIYVPAEVPHLLVNASKTEPSTVLVAKPEPATDGTMVPVPHLEEARLAGKTRWKP